VAAQGAGDDPVTLQVGRCDDADEEEAEEGRE